jgi:hypothetical protein
VLQTYASSVSEVCTLSVSEVRLQVFYIDVVKIDRDTAHVTMTIHICFKCMLQWFHLFQAYVANVLFECCKSRSIWMLHIHAYCKRMFSSVLNCFKRIFQTFHLDVAYILQWLHTWFSGVLNVYCKCFSCFGRMLNALGLGSGPDGLGGCLRFNGLQGLVWMMT